MSFQSCISGGWRGEGNDSPIGKAARSDAEDALSPILRAPPSATAKPSTDCAELKSTVAPPIDAMSVSCGRTSPVQFAVFSQSNVGPCPSHWIVTACAVKCASQEVLRTKPSAKRRVSAGNIVDLVEGRQAGTESGRQPWRGESNCDAKRSLQLK